LVPDAMVIRRDAREVALSYWRRGSIPGRTKNGKVYLLWPPERVIERASEYQLCYWHALAMEERMEAQAALLRQVGARVYAASTADLVTREGFAYLVEYLQLGQPDWAAYEEVAGRRINATPAAAQDRWPAPAGALDAEEEEVQTWMQTSH
jgi:hypothetical protein